MSKLSSSIHNIIIIIIYITEKIETAYIPHSKKHPLIHATVTWRIPRNISPRPKWPSLGSSPPTTETMSLRTSKSPPTSKEGPHSQCFSFLPPCGNNNDDIIFPTLVNFVLLCGNSSCAIIIYNKLRSTET